MAEKLVIVESPTKARTISRYLGDDYEVKASGGHVRDLPEKEFGVDVENNFQPTYRLLPGSRRTIGSLRKSSQKAKQVYLAPDPDREGEAIAWHLIHALNLPAEKARRATFHEITEEAVREAFESPGSVNMDLVNAQQARRILDRIVGYELSPLISKKIVRGLSAGRVQSVALRLVVERERQIEAFEPEEYWKITAGLAGEGSQEAFEAELEKLDGEDASIGTEAQAQEAVQRLEGDAYRVSSVEKRRTSSRPAPPFITSTLQQTASSRLGMSIAQVMRVAQQLYEGVDIEGQSEGLITYMRTDSTRVAERALQGVRQVVEEQFGKQYLPSRPNRFKNPAGAQAAHEAIRPTDTSRSPDQMRAHLSKRQYQLYDLIWRRFVASQMKPASYLLTTVRISTESAVFLARGQQTVFPGYTRVMPTGKKNQADQSLPDLQEGEQLQLRELVPSQHFTEPPHRYTEATLVRELERLGIGRPSTYAPTISTLVSRNYVRRRRRALVPTDLGGVVTDKLVQHFPREVDYGFTSEMEQKLDRIEQGEADWRGTLREFYEEFKEDLERAREQMTSVTGDEHTGEQTCPKCGEQIVVRFSRQGDRFLGCSGFPKCDYTVSLEEAEETEHMCPQCGSPMVKRTNRRGNPYLACSAYPECRHVMGLDKEGNPVELRPRTTTGLKCPRCSAPLYAEERDEEQDVLVCGRCGQTQAFLTVEEALTRTEPEAVSEAQTCEECGSPMELRRSRKGLFLGCSRYPECKGTRNLDKNLLAEPAPTHERCEQCGRPMVLRWGRYGRFLSCSGFPRCRNIWRLPSKLKPCPREDCEGHLLRKASAEGEQFHGCSRYPECDYTAPVEEQKSKSD